MKRLFSPRRIPLVLPIACALGFALQLWRMATGIDERQLLVPGHPAAVLSWLLAILTVAYLALAVQNLGGLPKRLFSTSALACGGQLVGGLGMAGMGIALLLAHEDLTYLLSGAAGVLGGVCLGAVGYFRWQGKPAPVVCHFLPAIFFPLLLICRYRQWSWISQLSFYVFPLLATIFLMAGAYGSAALHLGLSRRRSYVFCSQAAALFCAMAAPAEYPLFYLAMAAWMLTGHCSLKPVRRHSAGPKPQAPEAPPEPPEPVEEVPPAAPLDDPWGLEGLLADLPEEPHDPDALT